MPRYVLLYHECPPGYERPSHWDLMLEAGDKLRTWALTRLPRGWEAAQSQTAMHYPSCSALADDDSVAALRLADHRIEYLHEQGLLSGNRGEVHRIDEGTYDTIAESSQNWTVVLSGVVIAGEITLQDSMLKLNL